MMIDEMQSTYVEAAIAILEELGINVLIDQDAITYLNQYKETRFCRPDGILDIELSNFDRKSFYRLIAMNKQREIVAYCAARLVNFKNDLINDAKLLPPPHPVEDWSTNCHVEFKGEELNRISGRTIYLGGLWVRPNVNLPQIAILMPRLLASAITSHCRDPINWIWGIFDLKAGIHLGRIYGFDEHRKIEIRMHRNVGTSFQRIECLADQALSWASPASYFSGLATAL